MSTKSKPGAAKPAPKAAVKAAGKASAKAGVPSLALYERMSLIRQVEQALTRLFANSEVPGFIHLSIGQEAVAAGIASAMLPQDTLATTHRGHGHVLARGMDVTGFMKENMQARDRSSRILAALSAAFCGIFTCNANKTETTVGYGTLYGDLAGAFLDRLSGLHGAGFDHFAGLGGDVGGLVACGFGVGLGLILLGLGAGGGAERQNRGGGDGQGANAHG